jgi:PAS domain S-box-containing protein
MFDLDPSTSRDLLENSMSGLVIVNRDLEIEYVNNMFCSMCGYSRDELYSRNVLSLVYEEDVERIREDVNMVLNGEWAFEELRYKTKLGEVRWVSGLIRPIKKDGETYIVGSLTDITGMKELNMKLEESEAFYRELIEGSAAPMYIVQNGRFVFINRMVEELVGYKREELFQMNPFDLVHPADREMVFRRYFEREQGLRNPETYSFRVLGKDRVGWFTMVSRRIMYRGEPAVYVTGFESTEIFTLNEELKRTNEILKNVISRLKENINAMATLVDKIRNPLSALLGYAELFGEEEVKSKIFEQVKRINEIVSKIDQEWLSSEKTVDKLIEIEKSVGII